jgi:transcriptional regulator with XRE-family HTH domain
MRIIDRLLQYLAEKKITAYSFERNCKVANGYLKKQQKGKGSVGSDILERIYKNYLDLSLIWLISGEGEMLVDTENIAGRQVLAEKKQYYTKDEHLQHLAERIALLETSLADKEKIIALLEAQLLKKKL